MIASVKGTLISTLVPCPNLEKTLTEPLSDVIRFFTTSIPTPRPEISDIFCLVEKPGAKIKLYASVSDIALAVTSSIILFVRAKAFKSSGSIPLPSSSIFNDI